jgi:FixJ family two-component response regulator
MACSALAMLGGAPTTNVASQRRYAFLVVDDEVECANALRRFLLQIESVVVVVAYSVHEALDATPPFGHWNGMVIDVRLGYGKDDGFHVHDSWCKRGLRVPALFVTSDLTKEVARSAQERGAQALGKQVTLKDLTIFVDEALRRTDAEYRCAQIADAWQVRYGFTVAERNVFYLGLLSIERATIADKRAVQTDTVKKQAGHIIQKTRDRTFAVALQRALLEALVDCAPPRAD